MESLWHVSLAVVPCTRLWLARMVADTVVDTRRLLAQGMEMGKLVEGMELDSRLSPVALDMEVDKVVGMAQGKLVGTRRLVALGKVVGMAQVLDSRMSPVVVGKLVVGMELVDNIRRLLGLELDSRLALGHRLEPVDMVLDRLVHRLVDMVVVDTHGRLWL